MAAGRRALNVALLTQCYYPGFLGGAEIHLRNVAVHLAKQGHSIVVITRGGRGSGVSEEDGVTVDRVPTWPLLYSQRLAVVRFVIGLVTRFHARRHSIDVIHALPIASMGFFAAVLGQVYRKPVVVRDGNSEEDLEEYLESPVHRFMARYALRHANTVYCDHPSIARVLGELDPKIPVPVVTNPVDADEFAPSDGRSPSSFVVLHVSRLVGFKGLRHVIEALPAVRERIPHVLLRVVGGGPEEDSLHGLVDRLGLAAQVEFTGAIPFAEVSSMYRDADVFVQPSLTEELPNTVLQALAAGLPVIASTRVATADILVDGKTALLVEPGDVKAIGEALLRIHDDRGLREALGSAARTLAVGDLSWKAHGDRIVDLYEAGLADS